MFDKQRVQKSRVDKGIKERDQVSKNKIKLYFKTSEDKPENGLMGSLQRKQALFPIKFSPEIISRSTTLIKF